MTPGGIVIVALVPAAVAVTPAPRKSNCVISPILPCLFPSLRISIPGISMSSLSPPALANVTVRPFSSMVLICTAESNVRRSAGVRPPPPPSPPPAVTSTVMSSPLSWTMNSIVPPLSATDLTYGPRSKSIATSATLEPGTSLPSSLRSAISLSPT